MYVHYRGKCYKVKDVTCEVKDVTCMVPTESKWNKGQPQLVIRGFAQEVIIRDDRAIIK